MEQMFYYLKKSCHNSVVSDLWMKIPLKSQIIFFFLSVNLSTFLSDVCGEAEKKKENKKQNK